MESRLSSRDSAGSNSGLESPDSTIKGTTARFASTPPTGEANKVNDLALTDNGDGTYTLTWHYRNLGDYDQNGTVGIPDITPIAMHYGESYDIADVNCLLAVIDGSGNGVVDIADITPIAMYYAVDVASYSVRSSAHEWGAYTEIDAVGFGDATGGDVARKILELPLVPELGTWYRVVPQDGAWNEGVVSDAVLCGGDVPPEVLSVSPLSGTTGTEVRFCAVIAGATPITYSWDFGGGAEPDTSTEESPTVVLSDSDTYNCSLTTANAYGEDMFEFVLNVVSEPTFAVSGHVEKDTSGGLPDVILTLAPEGYTGSTDGNGDYAITGVSNGTYTLVPSQDGWAFTPPNLDVVVNDEDVLNMNFTARERSWHIEDVDITNNASQYSSLALDSLGRPHIFYYHQTDSAIKYVCRNSTWHLGLECVGDAVGGHCSMALDSDDFPHLCSWNLAEGDLTYFHSEGVGWSYQIADHVGGLCTSIAVDSYNLPHISHWDIGNDDLRYTFYDGENWHPEIVDSEGWVGRWTSLALDSSDEPHIIYQDRTNNRLKYAYHNASGWHIETVASYGDYQGQNPRASLAIDSSDHPCVSYYDYEGNDLKYAHHDGSGWHYEIVDNSSNGVGMWNSLALDSEDHPHVSYCKWNLELSRLEGLKYACRGETGWRIENVDLTGAVGSYNSLALDSSDYPHISYCGGGLKYAVYY